MKRQQTIAWGILLLLIAGATPFFVYLYAPFVFRAVGTLLALRIYDVWPKTLLVVMVASALVAIIHSATIFFRRSVKNEFGARFIWAGEVLTAFAAMLILVHWQEVPLPYSYAATIAGLLGLLSPLRPHGFAKRMEHAIRPAIGFLLGLLFCGYLFYLDHRIEGPVGGYKPLDAAEFILQTGWVALSLIVGWLGMIVLILAIGGKSDARRLWVSYLISVVTAVVCVLTISLGCFSASVQLISPHARRILDVSELYDAKVDAPGGRLLVTETNRHLCRGRSCGLGFSFRLDDLAAGPRLISVPTIDLENIALDPVRREIYHVDRETNTVLVLDADTFEVKRSRLLAIACPGTVTHALVPSAQRLFLAYEGGTIYAIDTETLEVVGDFKPGQDTNIKGEDAHQMLYVSLEFERSIEARDARTLKLVRRVPGPLYTDRMTISPKRKELYLRASITGEVWVYSVPDLELVRKIPTTFGVRILAVDEDNGLLFAANYLTGYVDVIELDTSQTIQHHFVAKYGRTLAADHDRRHLFFTTTKEGLFVIAY